MSLTATVSRNPIVIDTYDGQMAGVPIVNGGIINQGDMCVWDSTLNSGNGAMRTPVTQADMAKYLGVAAQQSPQASLGDTYNTLELIHRGVCVRLKTTPGDVYVAFAPVYFNETVDVQTVTVSTNSGARTVIVGYVRLSQQAAMQGITSLTGAAGVDVGILLSPNFPTASY